MKKIRTILRKEWAEVFKNRMVFFTVAFLPLLLTAIPLVVLATMRDSLNTPGFSTDLPPEATETFCQGANLGSADCLQVFLVSQFMLMFMVIPVAIPVTMAAYSIVGEKTTRSLEPLLATPITTLELLAGKSLAAVIPAVLATFAAFGLFALGSWVIVGGQKMLFAALFAPRWLIAVFVVGPLLALLAVIFALMVSSRVNDPRVAEQISMVIIVPVLVGLFGQMAGFFVLNTRVIALVALVMLCLDAFLFYLAGEIFQRESILTRWK
jgi:ABC-2 type transport system permease protein